LPTIDRLGLTRQRSFFVREAAPDFDDLAQRASWKWFTKVSGLIWIDLLLSCVLDKHDITVLATSTEGQLFAVRRPHETDQSNSVEMRYLIQCAISDPQTPDVVAVLPLIDIGQLPAVRTPADAGR
jgi:hypothetical protein